MKFIFSESETRNEIVAQQIDFLSSWVSAFPTSWRKHWEQPSTEEMDMDDGIPRRPMGDRETWPPLEEAFEEFVQMCRRNREAAD
jgi:serine/threonine-protein kinase SRPK3